MSAHQSPQQQSAAFPQQPPSPQPRYAPPPAAAAPLNVLAVIAICVAALNALSSFVSQFIFYAAVRSGDYGLATVLPAAISWFLFIATAALGTAALLQKRAARGRWAAWAALGAAGAGMLSSVASVLGSGVAPYIF